MSDIKLKLETEDAGASRNLANYYAEVNKVDKEMKDLAASAKKAGRAASAGMKEAGSAAGKTTKELSSMNDMTARAATNITSWLGSFATIAAVTQGVRSLTAALRETSELQAEMFGTAVDLETQMIKIAQLRGDITPSGMAAVRADIADVRRKTHLSTEVTASSLFFAESSLGPGTAAAKSAATAMGVFAGPAGLTAEEVQLIPKLFSTQKADTYEKQMEVLNITKVGTGGSIAETGEYLEPYVNLAVILAEREFTLEQTTALMTAGIEAFGPRKAGRATRIAVDIATGKTEASKKWLTERAAERGLDFRAMSSPERMDFTRSLYQEYRAADRKEEFETGLNVGQSFQFVESILGEAATAKYNAMLPLVKEARKSTEVQEMGEQYPTTLKAVSTDLEEDKRLAEAETGEEKKTKVVLDRMTEAVLEQVHANVESFGEHIGLIATIGEKRKVAEMIIRENFALAWEDVKKTEDPADDIRLKELYKKFDDIKILSTNLDFVEQAFIETEGFNLVRQKGRVADWESVNAFLRESYTADFPQGYSLREEDLRPEVFMRGFKQYFEVAEKLTEAAKELTKAAGKLDRAVPSGMGEEGD